MGDWCNGNTGYSRYSTTCSIRVSPALWAISVMVASVALTHEALGSIPLSLVYGTMAESG